jgi:hypothetical protein
MVNSIPLDQLKYRAYRTLPVILGLSLAFIYALVITGAVWFGATLSDLAVPVVMLIIFWVFSVSLGMVNARIQAGREKVGIDALFAEPPWATWQYTPEEWQTEYEQIYRGEKQQARASCSYLLVGPVFGGIFLLVGFFTRNSPYSSFLIFIGVVIAVGLMLLGIIQFYRGRTEAQQHYAAAQQIPSPLLIFGEKGFYQQVKGYTSLRRLYRAEILSPQSTDRIEKITYTYVNKRYQGNNLSYLRLHVRGGWRRHRGVVTLAIPQRYEADTEQLVQRYNNLKGRGVRR